MKGITSMLTIRLAVLGSTLIAMLAGGAEANDKQARALTIPAAACTNAALSKAVFNNNQWLLSVESGSFGGAIVYCPLPLSNIGAGNSPVKLSKFRSTYRDSDGRGPDRYVQVELVRVQVGSNGELTQTSLCQFDSNLHGGSSTEFQQATQACTVTLEADSLYGFTVLLATGNPLLESNVSFVGIAFPQ